jgi:hypothetical protein
VQEFLVQGQASKEPSRLFSECIVASMAINWRQRSTVFQLLAAVYAELGEEAVCPSLPAANSVADVLYSSKDDMHPSQSFSDRMLAMMPSSLSSPKRSRKPHVNSRLGVPNTRAQADQ